MLIFPEYREGSCSDGDGKEPTSLHYCRSQWFGKDHFCTEVSSLYADCINFVDADLIAAGLSPFSPDVAAIKAGRIMLADEESGHLTGK